MVHQATLILRDVAFTEIGDVYATEGGTLAALRKGVHVKAAFGDFDSVDEEAFSLILKNTPEIHRVSSIKDETDSELAIRELITRGYDEIHVYGALGERADHQHINLQLMYRFPQVILEDESQRIQAYTPGDYSFNEGIYTYFSVFTFESATISLRGFRYPLDHFDLTWDSLLTVSNEWNQEKALMQVHQGKVWVVQSRP